MRDQADFWGSAVITVFTVLASVIVFYYSVLNNKNYGISVRKIIEDAGTMTLIKIVRDYAKMYEKKTGALFKTPLNCVMKEIYMTFFSTCLKNFMEYERNNKDNFEKFRTKFPFLV